MKTDKIQFTHHGKKRIHQRGIDLHEIDSILKYGRTIHKQGLEFHYLPKSIGRGLGIRDPGQLSKLMVVTAYRVPLVITCYKHDRAVHRVKKKSKRLEKYKQESFNDREINLSDLIKVGK